MKNVLYAQLISIFAMLTISFSVQCRKKKHMMMVQSFAHMLYAFQYALLGAFSAAYMDIIAVLRNLLFYKYDKNRKQIPIFLSISVIILTLLVGYFSYNNILSLFPVIIAILYTIGASFKDPKVYKYVFGFCAIGWLFYNFRFKAYVCVIGNIIEVVSTIIALIRENKYKRNNKKRNK